MRYALILYYGSVCCFKEIEADGILDAIDKVKEFKDSEYGELTGFDIRSTVR